MLGHNSLANYYTLMFGMAQHHKYSLEELANLIVYERDIYVAMLLQYLEKENMKDE